MLAKCSEQSRAKHVPNVPNVPHVPNVPNTNIVPVQHREGQAGPGLVDKSEGLAVLARNNVRVRNVRNVWNLRNMFGPSLLGTFGQH